MKNTNTEPPPPPPQYGEWWRRLLAHAIDSALFALVPISLLFTMSAARSGGAVDVDQIERWLSGGAFDIYLNGTIALIVPYYVVMTSSSRQGTLGKIAVGLKVTDLARERVSLSRALGRLLMQQLSLILVGIGFLIQPFTQKRQALHDILARTLVVKR